jgi:hypothetical protein
MRELVSSGSAHVMRVISSSPLGREDRECSKPDAGSDLAEVLQELVQLKQRRATDMLLAMIPRSDAFRNRSGVLHRLSVERALPSRLGDREDGAQMRQVIANAWALFF